MNENNGCPKHGRTYLSLFFNDLEDKLYEHCTVSGCEFSVEHKNRRKEQKLISFTDRRKGG
jgi:hypothetical protein